MKASTNWSHSSLPLIIFFLFSLSCLIFFSCSKEEDDGATPVLTKYEFPPEVVDSIFAGDRPGEIRNVDEFLDRIVRNGMIIHEGSTPPEVFHLVGAQKIGVKFNIENDCIYDEKAPANVDSVYGKSEETILIYKNQQNIFVAEAGYSSLEDAKYPQFPNGLDRGSGAGFVSGNGNNFTIFYKVKNGIFGNVPYQALWIISGTLANPSSNQKIDNVTKCLVMLQKGEDPEDRVGNPGTIRIFKDIAPDLIQPEVVIDVLSPEREVAGGAVTITGSGFSPIPGENTVLFGTLPATVQAASTTQLTVMAPAGQPGPVAVTVQVGEKTSNSKAFTFLQPEVVLQELSPGSGLADTTVTITGSGFSSTAGENTVRFGTVVATVQAATTTQLTVTAPAGPTGGGTVQVTVQVGEKTSNGLPFTYLPPLIITALNPGNGVAETPVTITGTGFSLVPGENFVRFDTAQTTVLTASATQLTVTAPAGPTGGGTVQVTVQVGNRTSNSSPFTYLPPVVITALNPTNGVTGTTVTITGSGFSTSGTSTDGNIVRFGSVQATVQAATTTQLTVTAPAGPTSGGTVEVTVQVGTRTSNGLPFTYQPPLVITALNPASGAAGDTIAITGTGFSTTPGENFVRFGTAQTTVLTASATQLIVTAPAGPTAGGTVQVTVQVGNRASNTSPFTYLPPLIITALNPTSGDAETSVMIVGSGFSPVPGENIVRFGTAQIPVQTASATQLTVTAPTGPPGGGIVEVTVQVGNRTSNNRPFTYLPPLVITSLNPTSGQAETLVTITGSGFSTISRDNIVRFGSVPVTVRTASATQLTVMAPAGPAGGGTVEVTVQVGNRTSNTSPFTYLPPLVITGLNPSSGKAGTRVVITGTGFDPTLDKNAVRFGTGQARVLDGTLNTLIVEAPTGQSGIVPVTVQVGAEISNSREFTYLQ